MGNVFKFFKNTDNEVFVKLENIVLIPFGPDYIFDDIIPVQMATCYSDGVILKYNVPCATIDTQSNNPVRIKDIVTLLPNVDILPLSDERFKLKNPKGKIQENGRVAKKYLDYLVDVYKKNTGEYKGGKIVCGSKVKPSEEAFIDVYFELCCQQIKDAKEDFWTKNIRKEAEEIFEEYQRKGWRAHASSVEGWEYEIGLSYDQSGLNYPFNDGRILFEMLLPLHSARMSLVTSDIGSMMRQYRPFQSVFDKTIHDGSIDNQELIPKWSAEVNPKTQRKSLTNKERVSFYELDFLFWDGQKFIGIELDGDGKTLADYSAKKENLENCSNFTLKNLANEKLSWLINHFNSESSPDLEYRTQTLSALFSEPILKFWETVEDDSPLRRLFNDKQWDKNNTMYDNDCYELTFSVQKKRLDEEVYPKLPWHLRYSEGHVYFDDPTE